MRFVKPSYENFIHKTLQFSDVVIPRGGGNDVAINLIVEHIRTKLNDNIMCRHHSNLKLLNPNYQGKALHTIIRDKTVSRDDFVFYSNRLIRLVVEEGLGCLPFEEKVKKGKEKEIDNSNIFFLN